MKQIDRRWFISWMLLGLLLGAALGYLEAGDALRQSARTRLDEYASHLAVVAQQISAEINTTSDLIAHDGFEPCSDADLNNMRNLVFHALFLRDIGRHQQGRLMCTSGIGRFAEPPLVGDADVEARGARIRVAMPLFVAPGSVGFVVQRLGVSMVINSRSFGNLDEPPMIFGFWVWVPEKKVLLQSFGHDLPLSRAEITSGRMFEHRGWLYRSVCPRDTMGCLVTGVPLAQAAPRPGMPLLLFTLSGASLGLATVLIGLLYVRRQRSIASQLRRALRNGELRLEYQPIVDLITRDVIAVEVLTRWGGAGEERIRPDVFIAAAEENGMICELTRYVVRAALRDLRDLLATEQMRVSINISSHDLADPEFPVFMGRELEANGLQPRTVSLEITERSTAKVEVVTAAIERLRREGHRFAIDDFGTGYSSLSYLHELDVDVIKIDRRFTSTVGTEAVTASVVPQILAMARQLGLQIVVEGIETAEQAEYFAQAFTGAWGQGYLFGRPMPPALLREWLRRSAAPISAA